MLTVQEIQTPEFEKAVFGGYDQKAVDDFMETVAADFASLQKENAALKSKMKVLVDKIEEYRSVENGMRRALVSAQSIAQETIDTAQAESAQLIAEAKQNADEQIDPGAIDHAAEDVPPVEVRAEGMLDTGRDEAGRRGHLQRVVRGEDSGKQGDDDHQKYDQPAGNKCHPGHPQRQPALLGVIGSLFHTAASLVECNPGVQEGIE